MSVSASEFDQARKIAKGVPGGDDPGKARTEDVVRMYGDDEKVAVISKKAEEIEIGTPPQKIVLRPLSVRQMITFLPKLKTTLGPLLLLFKDRKAGDPPIPIPVIIEALIEHIEDLPELLLVMLERGNADIDKLWIEEHLDVIPDMMRIVPIFLRQNGLDKLFNLGKPPAPSETSSKENGASSNAEVRDKVTGSLDMSTSPATITAGPTSTS